MEKLKKTNAKVIFTGIHIIILNKILAKTM